MNSVFEDIMLLLLSVACAVVGTLAGVSHSTIWNQGQEAQKILVECEKNLPRNQHCKLVAIPAERSEVEQPAQSASEGGL